MRVPLVAVALGLLLLIALALRWPIASHDVEHYFGPDEGELVENVLEMMKTGDFDQRHPGYPALHFYLQMAPLTLHLLHARLEGRGRTIADLPRSGFYLAARRTTLVAGLLAALVVFVAGRRFLTPWGAVFAASLVAMSPLGFRESAVVNPDLMLSLFVSLALWSSLRLAERERDAVGVGPHPTAWTRFAAAGVAVGLATAIKYTGALTVFPYAASVCLGPEPKRYLRIAFAGLAAGAIAFALASPYTFVHLGQTLRGLAMHVGYYQASDRNAALELLDVLFRRGLGPIGFVAAIAGAVRALSSREPRRLVVLSFPVFYLLLFACFERAFPRHALPLLPPLALLSADAVEWAGSLRQRAVRRLLPLALAASTLAPLVTGSLDWNARSRRSTPAERAAVWAASTLPAGSRVLEDQYTPRVEGRFRVHRLRVEERVFAGNYDWVFVSGYPPGIDPSPLREVRRFEPEGALGDAIVVYQVPPRGSLMGITLPAENDEVVIGAGELPYFGEGWDPPEPGAYGTVRRSRGDLSEIYVVLPAAAPPTRLSCELTLGAAVSGTSVAFALELNGESVGELEVASDSPETREIQIDAPLWKRGLNRLVIRYRSTTRLDRRHREAAVWLSRLRLQRVPR